MISLIIFSFDNSMQLDLLLRTIELNAKDTFNINVLYTCSNDEFKDGYELLKKRFDNINWIEEINFKEQVIKLMDTDLEYSCFFVDDDIMFGKFNEEEIIKVLRENNEIFCFTPHQGLNAKKCYKLKCDNIILPDREDDNFIYWNYTNRYADAGYPLSLNGNVFRTKEIKKMVKVTNFVNHLTLEDNLQIFSENFPKEIIFAYKNSIVVTSINNENNFLYLKEMNDKYLNGYVIDFERIDFNEVDAAHCELNYEFKKYEI